MHVGIHDMHINMNVRLLSTFPYPVSKRELAGHKYAFSCTCLGSGQTFIKAFQEV